jgi:hypothetical protein
MSRYIGVAPRSRNTGRPDTTSGTDGSASRAPGSGTRETTDAPVFNPEAGSETICGAP